MDAKIIFTGVRVPQKVKNRCTLHSSCTSFLSDTHYYFYTRVPRDKSCSAPRLVNTPDAILNHIPEHATAVRIDFFRRPRNYGALKILRLRYPVALHYAKNVLRACYIHSTGYHDGDRRPIVFKPDAKIKQTFKVNDDNNDDVSIFLRVQKPSIKTCA